MGARHLTDEKIAEIKQLRAECWMYADIAEKVGVHEQTVGKVCRSEPALEATVEQLAEWQAKQKGRKSAYLKAYYLEHKQELNQKNKEYRLTHSDQCAGYSARRRARIRGATWDEPVSREEVFALQDGVCYLCGAQCTQDNWHMDHVIPLSKGGEHRYTNLAVTCPGCNLSKQAKLLEEIAA